MVSKSSASNTPKGQPKALESTWNFYLVLNDYVEQKSTTWKLPGSLEDALNAVWTLYDASLRQVDFKARKTVLKTKRTEMPKIEGVQLVGQSESLMHRTLYGKGKEVILYPWLNVDELQSPKNLTLNANGTIMLALMHDHQGTGLRGTRLEVRVRSTDGTITPTPERGRGMTMKEGREEEAERKKRFRAAVEKVMNQNLKGTQKRLKQTMKEAKKPARYEHVKNVCRSTKKRQCQYVSRRTSKDKDSCEPTAQCLLVRAQKELKEHVQGNTFVTQEAWRDVYTKWNFDHGSH